MKVETCSVAGVAVQINLRGRAPENESNTDAALVSAVGRLRAAYSRDEAIAVCPHQVAADHALRCQVTS